MKTGLRLVTLAAILTFFYASFAIAGSSAQYIKDLKSPDPDVRAKAAYELGCG